MSELVQAERSCKRGFDPVTVRHRYLPIPFAKVHLGKETCLRESSKYIICIRHGLSIKHGYPIETSIIDDWSLRSIFFLSISSEDEYGELDGSTIPSLTI